jgi:hypothetical protein
MSRIMIHLFYGSIIIKLENCDVASPNDYFLSHFTNFAKYCLYRWLGVSLPESEALPSVGLFAEVLCRVSGS